MYKAGEHEMVTRLTAIFNQAYRKGCVSTEWGQAEICPIYTQKGDFLRCENYRGVSLMSHACKLYESVLECRLHNIVEERLGPWQYGFRKGVATTYMIWMAMAEYMVPADLQIAIKSTYKTNKSRVSTNIGSGEWFTTESGVRQGSILSPILFVMYMDLVIKEVHQNNPDNYFVLAYADDIAQTATSIENLQECMTRWNESFNKYNLKLNLKKIEVLVVSKTEKEAVVTLDEYQLNQVTQFKYLGCITGSKGHVDEEINGRISKMSQKVGIMYRLLKYRHEPKKAKRMIHMTILRPILLHGHESWILTKKLKSNITAADMKVQRLVKGVTRSDIIRNADIYDDFKIKPIIETIQTYQLRWFDHVMRRDEETTAKKVLDLKVKEKRHRGRRRTSWIKYIDNIIKKRGTTLQEDEGRGSHLDSIAWRKFLAH